MPTFHYTALDNRGKKRKGYIEAESQAGAFTMLQEQHLLPVTLTSVSRTTAVGRDAWGSLKDLLPGSKVRVGEAFYYLGLLLQSGSALAEALELLGKMSGPTTGRIWLTIRDAVETGESLSSAMGKYPRIFPKVYVGMVKVAESIGRLGQVLEKIAQYEEQRSEVRQQLATAMVYPMVIFLVGAGAVYFLLSQVLPSIAKIFSNAKQGLPLSTLFLLEAGQFLKALGPAVVLLPILLGLFCVVAYQRLVVFRARIDRWLWKLPLVQKYNLARFSGLLGFQLEAGIPLVQAMESAGLAVSSTRLQAIIRQAQGEVSAGQPLDKVLARTKSFPEFYILTLSSGQKAGRLGAFLLRLTRLLERDVDAILRRVVALAEPLLILCIGVVIGFIVISILEPIFSLSSLVK